MQNVEEHSYGLVTSFIVPAGFTEQLISHGPQGKPRLGRRIPRHIATTRE